MVPTPNTQESLAHSVKEDKILPQALSLQRELIQRGNLRTLTIILKVSKTY